MRIKSRHYIPVGKLEMDTARILQQDGIDITPSAVQAYSNFYDFVGRFIGVRSVSKLRQVETGAPIPHRLVVMLEQLVEKGGENGVWKFFNPVDKPKNLPKYIVRWIERKINPADYVVLGAVYEAKDTNIEISYKEQQ